MRQTRRPLRSRPVTRSINPTRIVSSSAGDLRRRPSARCDPIERRRWPLRTRRGSRLCASACRWRPDARPSSSTSVVSASWATWPTVRIPRCVQLARGHRADAPQPLDRQRVQERDLLLRRHHEQAVWLGHAAGHLRQVLRPRHADGDREADLLAHPAPQPRGHRRRGARDPPHAAHVEERLVDRQPLDQRGRVVEQREHGLARVDVGREPRRDDHGVRAQLPRPLAAHRAVHAARLRLVAGREDHSAADDHGPPAQARVVALLDRREERVEVRVQDDGVGRHEHMFASPPAEQR